MIADNRRIPAEPAPASTGREPIYQVQYIGEYASSVWHDATEDAYHTFMPERRRIVYAAPVAARELDVEAERREFEAHATERGLTLTRGRLGDGYYLADTNEAWKAWCKVAARSAAQSTAPVSTEQAGDAWISVQDRLPEPGERVLVTRFAGRVINPGHPGHPGLPWIEVSSIQPGLAIFSCDLCSTGSVTHWKRAQAAPSPNNSPVGADKELKCSGQ